MLLVAEHESSELHRKTVGDITEAYVAARLLELGHTVLRPIGDNARYDLVFEADGVFKRVQARLPVGAMRREQPSCSPYVQRIGCCVTESAAITGMRTTSASTFPR